MKVKDFYKPIRINWLRGGFINRVFAKNVIVSKDGTLKVKRETNNNRKTKARSE